MDSEVEILENDYSMVVIDDEDDSPKRPVPVEQGKQSLVLRIELFDTLLDRSFKDELSLTIQNVFASHRPMQTVRVRESGSLLEVWSDETLQTMSCPAEADDSLFIIDSTPKSKQSKDPIPSYKKILNKVFDGQVPDTSPSSTPRRPKMKQTCWNCEGDHGLKNCKKPRNYARIRQKKEEFLKKNDRYHADLEQKYGHFVPGKLSSQLRDALGLGSRDLPLHIYRMRVFGYPPGWLEEAKVTHSGLQLFDSTGEAVQHTEESEGQVDENRMKFDVRRIIEFPGFNEPPPRTMYDDSKYHNVAPYSDEMCRERMFQQLQGTLVRGYRRKKLKLSTVEDPSFDCANSTVDMETVDNDENCSEEKQSPQELEDGELSDDAETTGRSVNIDESVVLIEQTCEIISLDTPVQDKCEKRALSPSLDDLQQKQRQLMQQLADQSHGERSVERSPFSADILQCENQSVEAGGVQYKTPPSPLPSGVTVENQASPTAATGTMHEIVMSKLPCSDELRNAELKEMSLGTPILKAFTPYNSLPSGEAFSQGVSDVIHFENLPDSTGKYEQMKSLLAEVRRKINDHHRETDEEA
ncbi:zinc finger CCHC domain-containing protein 8 homolog [Anopheles cruzii]|uniref:zinc finger CCHC domain-containing protein 8 homolog n=1 Tax=Anopheles cruzii TaxID=68878 RepID=UPI0022EC97A7|nr:zinc finger CCHC domain-containing protein 8 homolog [Anopheles cruzii]